MVEERWEDGREAEDFDDGVGEDPGKKNGLPWDMTESDVLRALDCLTEPVHTTKVGVHPAQMFTAEGLRDAVWVDVEGVWSLPAGGQAKREKGFVVDVAGARTLAKMLLDVAEEMERRWDHGK